MSNHAIATMSPEDRKLYDDLTRIFSRVRDTLWQQKNAERRNAAKVARYASNPQPHREAVQRYRERNPLKVKAARKSWLERNPHHHRDWSRKKRRLTSVAGEVLR